MSKIRGDFGHLICSLMEQKSTYDAKELHFAIKKKDEHFVLDEIMCTRTNREKEEMKREYRHLFGKEMRTHFLSNTAGQLQRLISALVSNIRDDGNKTDLEKAKQDDALKLWTTFGGALFNDEHLFNSIFSAQNFAQLNLILAEFLSLEGKSFEQFINNTSTTCQLCDCQIVLLKCIKNTPAYFAELLYKTLNSPTGDNVMLLCCGTTVNRRRDLVRLVVTRSETDLANISNAYRERYGCALIESVDEETAGAYKRSLVAIIRGNR